MSEVWILLGHYKRKRSDLLGVYEHYERGKEGLDTAAFLGSYDEIDLRRMPVNKGKTVKAAVAAMRRKAKRARA